jgi:hypothetical protein
VTTLPMEQITYCYRGAVGIRERRT